MFVFVVPKALTGACWLRSGGSFPDDGKETWGYSFSACFSSIFFVRFAKFSELWKRAKYKRQVPPPGIGFLYYLRVSW